MSILNKTRIILDNLLTRQSGVLSDKDIKYELSEGNLVIEPFYDKGLQIQPTTVDLRLDNEFIIFDKMNLSHIDPLDENDIKQYSKELEVDNKFILHPGDFALAGTVERIEVPDYMIAEVEGRSSLGRLAIIVHATAGLCDPGYEGDITLELSNLGSAPVVLRPGMRICQLKMAYLNSSAEKPYGEERNSKYQDQKGPVSSRIGEDYEFKDNLPNGFDGQITTRG